MIEIVNGIEYTYVRIKSKAGIIRGAVPIGNDIVYPPLGKPRSKDEYAARGVDFVSKHKDGYKNEDYYKDMCEAYRNSLIWHKVVSIDSVRGKYNRNAIEFYKQHAGLEEKDAKQVKEHYAKEEKK